MLPSQGRGRGFEPRSPLQRLREQRQMAFYLMILPLLVSHIRDFAVFQKNYKFNSSKGYFFITAIPTIATLLSVEASKHTVEGLFSPAAAFLIIAGATICAILLSDWFFRHKIQQPDLRVFAGVTFSNARNCPPKLTAVSTIYYS